MEQALLEAAKIQSESTKIIANALRELDMTRGDVAANAAAIMARLSHANFLVERYDHKKQSGTKSAATLLRHLLGFADLESRHAMRQWHRCMWGELLTHNQYYTGRHSGMTIMIAEIQRLMKEEATQVEQGHETPAADCERFRSFGRDQPS